eukprot:jgi/Orpsp1_1/1174948/evm.model.c7180000052063.1
MNMNIFINLGNKYTTPLLTAIKFENINIIKYLIEHGADPNQHQQYEKMGENIITLNPIICAIQQSNKNIIQYLVEEVGINIPLLDEKNHFIIYAIKNSNFSIVKCLIKYHADINRKNEYGWTPLIQAMYKKPLNIDLIKYLIENGADINAVDNNNENALIHIIKFIKKKENGIRNKIIRYLIYHGAKLNMKDMNENNVLNLFEKLF